MSVKWLPGNECCQHTEGVWKIIFPQLSLQMRMQLAGMLISACGSLSQEPNLVHFGLLTHGN